MLPCKNPATVMAKVHVSPSDSFPSEVIGKGSGYDQTILCKR